MRAWAVIAGALVALGGCGLGPRVRLVVETPAAGGRPEHGVLPALRVLTAD